MSYQPYPGGGSSQPYPASGGQLSQRPPQPTPVRNAVWLMYAGAALGAITAILTLVSSSSLKSSVGKTLVKANATLVKQGKTPLTTAQIHSAENLVVGIFVFVLLVGIALWIWMAWANGGGRSWARIVASVLFALNTIFGVLGTVRAGFSVSVALFVLGWLVGLGALILLWQKESTAYIQTGQAMRGGSLRGAR